MVLMFKYHPPLFQEVMLEQLMVSMLTVLIQIPITVLLLFTPQTIMVVQAQPMAMLLQLMRMLPHLVIFIKIAYPIMQEVILVMTER